MLWNSMTTTERKRPAQPSQIHNDPAKLKPRYKRCIGGVEFIKIHIKFTPYFDLAVFCIVCESAGRRSAVWDSVRLNKLITTIFSSLCLYFCHFRFSQQIHLQPLVNISGPCGPGPSLPSTSHKIQPAVCSAMSTAIRGRSLDLGVKYLSVFHPKRLWTCYVGDT